MVRQGPLGKVSVAKQSVGDNQPEAAATSSQSVTPLRATPKMMPKVNVAPAKAEGIPSVPAEPAVPGSLNSADPAVAVVSPPPADPAKSQNGGRPQEFGSGK